jgi:hypothetical protein
VVKLAGPVDVSSFEAPRSLTAKLFENAPSSMLAPSAIRVFKTSPPRKIKNLNAEAHHTPPARVLVVILSGDFACGEKKSFL